MVAAKQVLQVLITADDKATGKLGKVASGLKKLSIVAAAAAVAGVALLAAGFIKLGITALNSGAEAQEMLSKLDATFGAAGAAMTQTLTEFGQAAGRSKFELLGMATDLGAVAKALGFSESEAANMASTMTQLAVDVGSFNDLPSAEVAQRFTRALTGEFESLKALGIVINAATLDEELFSLGFEEGALKVDAQTKALAVANIIMRQTTDSQGDAIKTTGSWTNLMIRLKAIASDLTTELGLKLIPVLTPLIEQFSLLAQDAVPILTDMFENVLIPAIEDLIVAIPLIIERFQPLISFLSANAMPILTALGGTVAVLVVAGFLAMAAAAWAFVAPFLPIIAVVALVVAAIAFFANAWKTDFHGMRTALTAFWENTVKPAFDQIVAFLQVAIPAAISTVSGFWTGTLLPAFQAVGSFIDANIIPLFQAIGELLSAVLAKYTTALAGLWQNVLFPAFKIVGDFITGTLVPAIKGALGPAFQWLANTVISGLSKAFNNMVRIIKSVTRFIGNLARSIGKINLPKWLKPGSPTPFELGLLGIANALKKVSGLTDTAFSFPGASLGGVVSGNALAGAGAGALGGGQSIQIIYAPILSTASEDELKANLAPILASMGVEVG